MEIVKTEVDEETAKAEIEAEKEVNAIYETICADIGGGVIKLFALSLNREAVRGTLKHIEEVAHDRWTRRDTIVGNDGQPSLVDVEAPVAEFEVGDTLKYKEGDKIMSGNFPYVFRGGKMVRDI